jgi:hypothetical protein
MGAGTKEPHASEGSSSRMSPKDKRMPGLMFRPRKAGEICRSEASLKRNRQLTFERNVHELLNALKNEVPVDIYK